MATEILTVKKIENALEKSGGLKTHAATLLGVHYHTIWQYFERYPELHKIHERIIEVSKDVAEDVLFHHLKKKSLTAAMFYLKCKAKDRGYIERQEITGKNGGPIESHIQVGVDDEFKQLMEIRKKLVESVKMIESGGSYIAEGEVKAKEKPKKKKIIRKRLSTKAKVS